MTRRWNGWGDDATPVELPHAARALLEGALGRAHHVPGDLLLDAALARVPTSRLPARAPDATRAAIATGAQARLQHAVGRRDPARRGARRPGRSSQSS